MPTRFSNSNFKRQGPQYLKDNITIGYVCKALLKADNYATMQGKAIASSVYAGTDVALTDSGDDVLTTINAKSGIDPSGTATAGEDICVAYCSASEVILVVDATDRIITNEASDTVDIPAAQHYSRETTVV